jgi:hypothetical protein
MLAQWIQDAKKRALAAREGLKVEDVEPGVRPYIAAVFTPPRHDYPDRRMIVVTYGEPDGVPSLWSDKDEYALANAELLAHARDDILRLVDLVEELKRESDDLAGDLSKYTAARAFHPLG